MKKTALITGASRGIGAAIATEFARNGYNLSLCCSKSMDQLRLLAEQLKDTCHVEVMTFLGDVGDFSFIQHMVQTSLKHFGSIEVLVNNAGISHIGLLSDMSIEEWDHMISVNLTSVFSTCKCLVPSMVNRKSGKIINISSVWGIAGASCEVAYSACKGGINAFTKALGKELAPSNIQVNAIACGVIDTNMNRCFSDEEREMLIDEIPAGRMGLPEEVAHLALSLSEGHDYLNGQIISLDGGWVS